MKIRHSEFCKDRLQEIDLDEAREVLGDLYSFLKWLYGDSDPIGRRTALESSFACSSMEEKASTRPTLTAQT
jgi:hypothetical protein